MALTGLPIVISYYFIRKTPYAGELFGQDIDTVKNSQFDPNRPTKIFLHGWFGAGWNWYIADLRMELLKKVDHYCISTRLD